MCRGDALVNNNMLDFFVDTYYKDIPHCTRHSDFSSDGDNSDNDDATAPRGQPCHDHIPYLTTHLK